MVRAEQVQQLERSLRHSADLLSQLADGLQARRAQWLATNPAALAPSEELESIAAALAGEDQTRQALLAAINSDLPRPARSASADLRINITRLARHLPTAAARSLRTTANRVVELAKRVRGETTLGARLLQFAQRAHEQVLSHSQGTAAKPMPGYDRHARRAGLAPQQAGNFLDGRI